MPSYKDMLILIRRGMSPATIVERMNLPPSRLQRMLKGKRLASALRVEADIARAMIPRESVKSLHEMRCRLRELAAAEASETARRACATLLEEARTQMNAEADRLRKITPLWMLPNNPPPERF